MNDALVYGGFIGLYLLLMYKAGKCYPILYLFAFTYFVQYVFSTYLIYNEYNVLEKQMPVSPSLLFGYAIPALIALFSGVFIFNKDFTDFKHLFQKINPQETSRLGYLLLFISYFFDALNFAGISYFDSVLSFTTYLKYVAAFCFLFSRNKFHYLLIFVIYIQLGVSAVASGVFITFFVWSTFLFFFISLQLNLHMVLRVSFIAMAVPILVLIQSVKHEYRKETWKGNREGGVALFSELVEKHQKENKDEPFEQSKGLVSTLGRLTQGWHLGMTLRHVPKREPFAGGSELGSDIVASILPRVLFSDKKMVNSQEKFERYTGHRLHGTTSMSIGVLGDFYINFGRTGSFFMLFVFGAFLAKMYNFFLRKYVLPDPINIIWLPFILSYLIRANNDFYIFFNGMVKGFIIFLVINYIRYHFLGARRVQARTVKPSYSA
jgi:hypothetical protein